MAGFASWKRGFIPMLKLLTLRDGCRRYRLVLPESGSPSLNRLIDLVRACSDAHAYRRESMGRDAIGEIEQCYIFMNRATNESLPRKILIDVDWDQPDSGCNKRDAALPSA